MSKRGTFKNIFQQLKQLWDQIDQHDTRLEVQGVYITQQVKRIDGLEASRGAIHYSVKVEPVEPPTPLGRIAALEAAVAHLNAWSSNHENADRKRKHDLDALTARLDLFVPLLSGDDNALETIIACLECNQADTNTEIESVVKRIHALERPVPNTDTCIIDKNGIRFGMAQPETEQERADRICGDCGNRGSSGFVDWDHELCHRACGALDDKPEPRSETLYVKAISHTARVMNDRGFDRTSAWLFSLASALEDEPAAPAPVKGTYGNENGF